MANVRASDQEVTEELSGVPEGHHCPCCGEGVTGAGDECPDCSADLVDSGRFEDLRSTAVKDRDAGTGLIRRSAIFLPLLVWRQNRIESAQRELLTYKQQLDAATELHCRACGSTVDFEEDTCGECGEVTDRALIDELEYDVHDPTEYDSPVSDRWWLGVIAGPVLGLAGYALFASLGLPSASNLLWAGGLAALACWYLDRKYLQARTVWRPPYWLYVPVLLIPVINLLGGGFYLWQRVSALGLAEHLPG